MCCFRSRECSCMCGAKCAKIDSASSTSTGTHSAAAIIYSATCFASIVTAFAADHRYVYWRRAPLGPVACDASDAKA